VVETNLRVEARPLQQRADRVARSRAFEVLARGGFVARGLVYGLVGVLAVKLALGDGGKATNQQGALETVARQPFGHLLVLLIAVGLGGYALWRLVRAFLGRGPEDGGDSAVDRIGGFGSGLVYAILCATAVKILLGAGAGGGNVSKGTAGVLGWPGGQWLVGLAGVVLLGIGGYQGYRGFSRDFLDESKVGGAREGVRRFVVAAGVVGHLARMVVFGLVGVFLVRAALDYQPRKAVGLGGALSRLLQQPAGPALLGVVAAGLVAFAVYSISDARYHRL
jgi:hypothetical protein